MASYHLSVKTVKRSAGRTATASAAYRAGERIHCEREGRDHDYTRKQGIEDVFILAPVDAPDWVQDRSALWNAAEAGEARRNSVTAREWEVALPAELSPDGRVQIARDFAQSLVDRFGVAADVAVHAPHREGDERNHHAHILTTTRVMGAEGLGPKTRVLDAAKTGGVEIEAMREVWGHLQNRALGREGRDARVDHRSLEAQREAALDRGDDLLALELDRSPEIKLGPAANAMERQAMRVAEVSGVEYEPVTQRGAQNHEIRERRDLLSGLRERAERAREVYSQARDQDASRTAAAIEATRAMFASSGAQAFSAGISAIWEKEETARLRVLEEAQERARLQMLERERVVFVESTAQAWEATWRVSDPGRAKAQQAELRGEVKDRAHRYGVAFEGLGGPINARAREIKDERVEVEELERVKDAKRLEREKQVERSRSDDYGPSR
ncbi:MobQ family relaxase [Halocynthiibacter namhaensis]|uniref:MobQ family relaxase n=1 Tax=Halocynthiibacter namhaensis TaxID=1290553 RepID=UPI00068DDA3E|nr:MobQ family relaxase [Halocynthiibacter namhaensis]